MASGLAKNIVFLNIYLQTIMCDFTFGLQT